MTGHLQAIEGAVAKKVYMHYEEDADSSLHLTLKLTLPAKWAGHTVDYLKEFFVENYNKKKPSNELKSSEFHLERKVGDDAQASTALYGDDLIHHAISAYNDLFLKHGSSKHKSSRTSETASESNGNGNGNGNGNLIRCRNYGCQAQYLEEDNHDTACRHHRQPPTFHDMKKGWGCCSSKMVYDWDDFERIEPCVVGRHCSDEKSMQFAKSPTVEAAENAGGAAGGSTPQPLKSIDDYNKANPNAVTAVSSAIDNTTAPKVSLEGKALGKARCVNFGCQKEYLEEENTPTSCVHHAGPPVFHDAGKHWSCCPKIVKYDFEDFLKIPGCVTSAHCNRK